MAFESEVVVVRRPTVHVSGFLSSPSSIRQKSIALLFPKVSSRTLLQSQGSSFG